MRNAEVLAKFFLRLSCANSYTAYPCTNIGHFTHSFPVDFFICIRYNNLTIIIIISVKDIVKKFFICYRFFGGVFMSTIGERIKEVRKQQKLNQTKFASELGISQNHVSNIENGNENPSTTLVKLISIKFNVSEEWIKDGIGTPITDFDIVSDEQLLKSCSGEDLTNIVEAFSYTISLFTKDGLSGEERTAYLSALCDIISLIETQVFASHSLGNYGKLGKDSYEIQLSYKTESEKRLILINQKIREMNNIYLKHLGAATEL